MKKVQLLILSLVVAFSTIGVAGAENARKVSDAEKSLVIINLEELEKEAERNLDKGPFGYVQGGAEDEVTLKDNRLAFEHKRIVPQGLSGLTSVDMTTSLLGIDLKSPIILAPMAAHGLMHKDGEIATAKGVAKADSIMSISTYASVLIEDVAKEVPEAPLFVMLYMSREEGFNEYSIGIAKKSGAKAIIITVDAGAPGNRETDIRNNYQYSVGTPNVAAYYQGRTVTQSEARASRKIAFTGEDIAYVKRVSGLPVLVKGIMSPQEADLAIKAGADGIWVSNHGGRQLDGAPSTFDQLPAIAKAVNKRVPIIFDSGIRRGSHVFRALASGADVVAIGRPALYGLNLGGSEGVKSVFDHLNKELYTVMVLAGTKNVEEIKKTELIDAVR